ncbi:MAG: hypothetical protein OXF93_15225 [Acidobacteria bacterium]|nr:hypothetical protein [Acidobacteriota bacterium]
MARFRVVLRTGLPEAVDADGYSPDTKAKTYWRFWTQAHDGTTETVAHYSSADVISISKVADDWKWTPEAMDA